MHEMILTDNEDGTEYWLCPNCGRKLRLRWEPFERVVLVRGDDSVQHYGGKGGVLMTALEVQPGEA